MPQTPISPRLYPLPGTAVLPDLPTIGDLAAWLRVDYEQLLWFADLHNRNDCSGRLSHYDRHVLAKACGTVRLLEVPRTRLKRFQRQILDHILSAIPMHAAVHGFREQHSILTFTLPHVSRAGILRIDLQDFFLNLTGPRIQTLFRTIGYPEPVADLLGGLCTTTTSRKFWDSSELTMGAVERQDLCRSYARPHLPQGGPASPALANLCAFRLDRRLAGLASAAEAVYTRYADDLAFSGDHNFARKAPRFADHVSAIVLEEGFLTNYRKTRWMRPSTRQHLAGLTLNPHQNVSRVEMDRLKATLTNCVRRGPASQNREQHPEFRSHLEGKVAFVAMVNPVRAASLQALLRQINWE